MVISARRKRCFSGSLPSFCLSFGGLDETFETTDRVIRCIVFIIIAHWSIVRPTLATLFCT